jgi:hypothetical protein
MAFDPDAYLATSTPATTGFDPDAYLSQPLAKPAASRGVTPFRAPASAAPTPVAKPPTDDTPIVPTGGGSPVSATGEVDVSGMTTAPDTKINYEELYKNPEMFKIVTDYASVAMKSPTTRGKPGQPLTYKEGESKEQFVQDFMSNMRGQDWNIFQQLSALNRLKNSPLPDKEKLALGQKLYDEVKSFTGEGGQPGMQPVIDIAGAALTDLTNYIGVGFGSFGKGVIKKEVAGLGAKEAAALTAKKSTQLALGATAADAAVNVGSVVAENKKQQEVAKVMGTAPEELSALSLGAAALFSAVGYGGAKAGMKLADGKTGAEALQDIINSKARSPANPNAPMTSIEKLLADPVSKNMDSLAEEFMNLQGARVLDDINPATPLTDSKIAVDMSKRAVRVALHVITTDPTFQLKPSQSTSHAIAEVFSNLDKVDDVVLENAIRREGLSPEQFAQANKLTVTEAAQIMQQYSVASKIMNRLTEIDPEAKKLVDSLFNQPDEITSAMGRVGQVIRGAERESKAWIVSGLDTTMRNVIGTGQAITFNSAASLVEGALYTMGRTLDNAAKGQRIATMKQGLSDTMKDAFGIYGYLSKQGLSSEVTDKLLEHNPAIRNNILSATQENSTQEISKVAQVFNTLNVAQDAFFRKALFAASVDKSMRRAGLDMYDAIANGKAIPASILKNAADETLKATFAYQPKAVKGMTFEAGAETAANLFIKAAELPGGSLFATFPRFMANAVAFQYRYSVFGAASGAQDMLQGAALKSAGKEGGDALIRKGQENLAKGIVGTASLAAAYDYRMNNQDTDWFNMKNADGTTVDTRSLSVLAPQLAIADFLVKRKQGLEPDTAGMLEAIAGMKLPAGTQATFLNQMSAAISSEKEADKMEIAIGKVLGDFTARFTQPFVVKTAWQFLDMFREQGAVQRDPNVLKSEGAYTVPGTDISMGNIVEAGATRVQGKIPILKESLPEAVPRLREGPVYKEGEFFYGLIGVRNNPEKTAQEKEITRLGIDPYKLYGPSSGDKVYDRAFVKTANPFVIDTIGRALSDPRYATLPLLEQQQAMYKMVGEAVATSRKIADAQFKGEDLNRVYKMQWNKLPAPQRSIINERYAKDHEGKTLEDNKDYQSYIGYQASLKDLRFSIGGMVGKMFSKAAPAGEKLSTILAKKAESSGAVAESIVNKVLSEKPKSSITPAIEAQMKGIVNTSAANMPSKKAAKAPEPMSTLKAAAEEPAMPVPSTPEAIPTELPKASMVETPVESAAFSPDQYAKGEKVLVAKEYQTAQKLGTDMDDDVAKQNLADWASSDPEGYAKALHDSTAKALKLQPDEIPAFVYKADESVAKAPWEEEFKAYKQAEAAGEDVGDFNPDTPTSWKTKGNDMEDMFATNEQITNEPTPSLGGPTVPFNEVAFGPVGGTGSSVTDRNAILQKIRTIRERSFDKLINNEAISALPDAEQVVGVVQGDFRAKVGNEVNPKNAADVAEFTDMAKKYQDKLDDLRIKYKDEPPVKLFHGTRSATNIGEAGFENPLTYHKYHSELRIGAPSFTRDLNLGYETQDFGGRKPEQYLYTEIPYADFVFQRVNMKPTQYDTKDMNILARAVNGSPNTVRSIGLPRSGMNETEDIIIEADKLVPAAKAIGNQPRLNPAKDIVEPIQAKIKERVEGQVTLSKDIVDTYKNILNEQDPSKSKVMANQLYGRVKTLMNSALDRSEATSTKTGLGQRYQNFLEELALGVSYRKPIEGVLNAFEKPTTIYTIEMLNVVSDILRNAGSTQKADVLNTLSKQLSSLDVNEYKHSRASAKQQKEAVNSIRELTPKFSKGGLASRVM